MARKRKRWMGRYVVVGERLNRARHADYDAMTPAAWAAEAMSVVAFPDAPARAQLLRIGIDLDALPAFNLLPPAPQDVSWDARRAAQVASHLVADLATYDAVYLCGKNVCRAFDLLAADDRLSDLFGQVLVESGFQAIPVPHPSGLNHWWNDPLRVQKMREHVIDCRRRR